MTRATIEPSAGSWRYQDYARLGSDMRHEVIEGTLSMVPAPTTNHQTIVFNIATMLRSHVNEHRLGKVFIAPLDVILDDFNVVQPDIVFVGNDRRHSVRVAGIFGPPSLVVEVLSPATQYRDFYQKKALYERFGVPEYWLVNPAMQSINVLKLSGASYTLHAEYCLNEAVPSAEPVSVSSPLLPALRLDLATAFETA
ncbi:MAG: Uma2 family endonuclease [Gammaproteobacteria bacterium]